MNWHEERRGNADHKAIYRAIKGEIKAAECSWHADDKETNRNRISTHEQRTTVTFRRKEIQYHYIWLSNE